MHTKQILLLLYYIFVIAVFINTVKINSISIGAIEIFFGVITPCFIFWFMHRRIINSVYEIKRTWVYRTNWILGMVCFTSGIVVLGMILMETSTATTWFISLPFIQLFLISVAIIAHITVYANPHNKELNSDKKDMSIS